MAECSSCGHITTARYEQWPMVGGMRACPACNEVTDTVGCFACGAEMMEVGENELQVCDVCVTAQQHAPFAPYQVAYLAQVCKDAVEAHPSDPSTAVLDEDWAEGDEADGGFMMEAWEKSLKEEIDANAKRHGIWLKYEQLQHTALIELFVEYYG